MLCTIRQVSKKRHILPRSREIVSLSLRLESLGMGVVREGITEKVMFYLKEEEDTGEKSRLS